MAKNATFVVQSDKSFKLVANQIAKTKARIPALCTYAVTRASEDGKPDLANYLLDALKALGGNNASQFKAYATEHGGTVNKKNRFSGFTTGGNVTEFAEWKKATAAAKKAEKEADKAASEAAEVEAEKAAIIEAVETDRDGFMAAALAEARQILEAAALAVNGDPQLTLAIQGIDKASQPIAEAIAARADVEEVEADAA